jgi:hypothetical protein
MLNKDDIVNEKPVYHEFDEISDEDSDN